MIPGRICKHLISYGVWRGAGKVLLAICCLASPLRAEEVTILALGDSLTQGYGLIGNEGLVPQLQAWLDGQGAEARLINGGVSGDTTAGGAARADWSLTPEVDAMILALGANDMLRGIDPKISRANLETILRIAEAKEVEVLLIGMRAPGNYGPEYKAAFDAIYPDLAEVYGTLLHPYFLAGLGEGTPDDLQPLMQSDAIHPNAMGVRRIAADIGPSVLKLIAQTAPDTGTQ